MKFTLEIETGNEAMRHAYAVAYELGSVIDDLCRGNHDGRIIRDANGNTVGKWSYDA